VSEAGSLLQAPLSEDERRAVRASLASGARLRARVVGSSMWPTLRHGEVVVLVDGAPRPGEVVAIEAGGRLVVHRLLRVESDRWILRGDANLRADAPVSRDALLGRVERVERGGEELQLAKRPVAPLRWLVGVTRRVAALRGRARASRTPSR